MKYLWGGFATKTKIFFRIFLQVTYFEGQKNSLTPGQTKSKKYHQGYWKKKKFSQLAYYKQKKLKTVIEMITEYSRIYNIQPEKLLMNHTCTMSPEIKKIWQQWNLSSWLKF